MTTDPIPDLKPYVYSHTVLAARILEVNNFGVDGVTILTLEDGYEFPVSMAWVKTYNPTPGGYLVTHEEGPTVFCEERRFKASYMPKEQS